jgi:uncharacterized membrane protein
MRISALKARGGATSPAPGARPAVRAAPASSLAARRRGGPSRLVAKADQNGAPARAASSGAVNYAAIAALAAAGCAETGYLAYAKLAGGGAAAVACPSSTTDAAGAVASACATVLSSPYASLFGLPLPLFGAAAYGALAAAAAVAASHQARGEPAPPSAARLAAASTGAVGTASAYLMWVLRARLDGLPCVWCYASALLSATLVALLAAGAVGGRRAASPAGGGDAGAGAGSGGSARNLGMPAVGASALAALVLLVGADPSVGGVGAAFANAGGESALTSLPYQAPEVTADSPAGAADLARRLNQAGARMYGAFWCSHCFDQKEAFGRAAMADFPYVECYPDGWRRGVDVAPACNAAGVRAFPTWRLPGGAMVEGELSLERLEASLQGAGAAADGAVASVPATGE